MAIIFENLSRCAICGEVLDSTREYTLFPPFTGNKKDPLFIFSDAGIHIDCLNRHPHGKSALHYRQKYDEYTSSLRARDVVDGQPIQDPEKIIALGLLRSDENEDLSE